MSFLAMIVALILAQAWGSGNRVQRDQWFAALRARVGGWNVPGGLRLALVVLVPAVFVQLVLHAIHPVLFGLPWIGLAAFLLLYSLGRRNFSELLERYTHQCQTEDFEGAYLTTRSELGWTTESDDPVSPQEVHVLVQREFFYEGFQRWFAVLFYFVLLGPAGALAYRLLQLCRQDFEVGLVERCLYLADWIPARLLAAAFSLTGDFVGSRDKLLDGMADTSLTAPQFLQEVGRAALDMDAEEPQQDVTFGALAAQQNSEMAGLMFRSAACWIAVFSLLVLLT